MNYCAMNIRSVCRDQKFVITSTNKATIITTINSSKVDMNICMAYDDINFD